LSVDEETPGQSALNLKLMSMLPRASQAGPPRLKQKAEIFSGRRQAAEVADSTIAVAGPERDHPSHKNGSADL
jgi:hypothetical protein